MRLTNRPELPLSAGPGGAVTPVSVLEAGLTALYGRAVRVIALEPQTLNNFSTHPIKRLRVSVDDGTTLSMIFKQIAADAGQATRREREVLVYRRLLAGRRFNAPELYGSHYDEQTGCYWLCLEDVGDWRLEYSGAGTWLAAFRWLARTHAECHGQAAALRALGCLEEHDRSFYRELWADARRQLAARGNPAQLGRFDRLTAELDRLIDELVAQPRSLVHGDLSCHNLAVQSGRTIRPLDWEWAAIGVPAWDVVRLSNGWGASGLKLVETYLEELTSLTGVPVDRVAFERSLAGCELFLICWYLRWWIAACHEPTGVDMLLDALADCWRRLYGEVPNG